MIMNRNQFYAQCPKTRKEFVAKYNTDRVFRNYAQVYGFAVIGDNVIFPTGKVANARVK